jgi:uncharacterized protein
MSISGRVTACVSAVVLDEYRDVLFRPKFAAFRDLARLTLNAFERSAELVHPVRTLHVSSDEDDNRFLECAAAAEAEFLVSGNLRHYPPAWGDTRIVNARGFFELSSIQ